MTGYFISKNSGTKPGMEGVILSDLTDQIVSIEKEGSKTNPLSNSVYVTSDVIFDDWYSKYVTHICIVFSYFLTFLLICFIDRNYITGLKGNASTFYSPLLRKSKVSSNIESPSKLNPNAESFVLSYPKKATIRVPHMEPVQTTLDLLAHSFNFAVLNEAIVSDASINPGTPVVNRTPIVQSFATPILCELNCTPIVQNFATPASPDWRANEIINSLDPNDFDGVSIICTSPIFNSSPSSGLNQQVCNDDCDESILRNEESLNSTHLLQKYVSKDFCDKNDVDHREVSLVLKEIRVNNVNRVIIGHLNVNFFAPKLDAIKTIIPGNIDIIVFSETKLDASYPIAQLFIDGFRKPFRKDRNANGGGLLIYVRSDIPCRQLNKHKFSDQIEGIFVEINFRKSKWLLLGTYHPPSQNDYFYFSNIERALDTYTKGYERVLLVGDFNAEETEVTLGNFMELYDLRNLVKGNTYFKSVQNPSCVDLFLTNCSNSFQNTIVLSTGISDCHKMIITVLKTTFKKAKPKEILYRSYKNFDKDAFRKDLVHKTLNCQGYKHLESGVLEVYNRHAPLKKRIVRANEVP